MPQSVSPRFITVSTLSFMVAACVIVWGVMSGPAPTPTKVQGCYRQGSSDLFILVDQDSFDLFLANVEPIDASYEKTNYGDEIRLEAGIMVKNPNTHLAQFAYSDQRQDFQVRSGKLLFHDFTIHGYVSFQKVVCKRRDAG